MDVRTWTTVSRLLDEALDLPPADREAWLERLAPEHVTLVPRLRAILSRLASPDTASFLATLPKFDIDDEDAAGDEPSAGADVGPFRLLRQIAVGGQGAVWLAERADGVLKRAVALKLPHRLAFRPGLADRMTRERDILATLTHPHIARLYDAGVTRDGVPFLALEYVEGTPIDRYCADHHLDAGACVRLFLQVVRAVAYAHGQLVIHRDLKPSNVLVTADGHVRLLDFGIARLLDDTAPGDSTLTQLGGRAMTLAYASPEQVSRAPLGVATDVYSLGVMLYELLTGARPCTPARDTSAALEDAILTQEAKPPSAVVGLRATRKALAGDLDTIVLHALRKDPAARYATAAAFADDLERYLDGRTVAARPDGRWYRARKTVARHRVAVIAATATLVALLVGSGVALWQASLARAEQRRAEDVKHFIVSLLTDANVDAGEPRQVSVLDLLKRAETRLQQLPPGSVKAELLIVLGEGLLGIGDTATLETVAQRAVAEAEAAEDDALRYRARLLSAWAHMYRGRPDAMSASLDAVAPALEREPQRYARELGLLWRLRAHAAIDAGRYDEAVDAATRALHHIEGNPAAGDTAMLTALTTLSEAQIQAGRGAEALMTTERALTVAVRVHGEAGVHAEAISARAKYANALGETGDIAAAIVQLQRVAADASTLFGADGRTVGFHLQRLANFQSRLGQIDHAVDSSRRALAIIEQHAEAGSPTRAAFHNTLGHALLAGDQAAASLPHLTAALDTATRVFGPAHVNTLNVRASRALALAIAGNLREAGTESEESLAAMRTAGQTLARPLYAAGAIDRRRGSFASADDRLRQAEQHVGDDSSLHWQIVAERALTALDDRRADVARPLFERALALARELGVRETPMMVGLIAAHRRAQAASTRGAAAQ